MIKSKLKVKKLIEDQILFYHNNIEKTLSYRRSVSSNSGKFSSINK